MKNRTKKMLLRTLNEAQSIAHIGSWEWDIAHDSVIWTNEMYRILDLEPHSVPPRRGLYTEYIIPEHKEAVALALKNAVDRAENFDIEFEIITAAGRHKYIKSQARNILNANRKSAFLIGTMQDITQTKRAELSLKRHAFFEHTVLLLAQSFINLPFNKLEQSIVEALGVVGEYCFADRVTIFRYDWKTESINHAYEWDRKPQYYAGDKVKEIPFAYMSDILDCHKKGEVYHYVKNANKEIPFDSITERSGCETGVIYPLYVDGNLYGTLGLASLNNLFNYDFSKTIIQVFSEMISNVLHRIKSDTELQQLNAFKMNSEILESISDGFYALDRQWCFTYVNRTAANIVGHSPDELLHRNIWELFPEIIGTKAELYYKTAMTEKRTFHYEDSSIINKGQKHYSISIYPSSYGISVYLNDITERLNAEKALRESEKRALALVDELKNADKNKNKFLNALSHELRNPLAAIISGLSLLEMIETQPSARKVIDIINRQSNHLSSLVDGLIDVTRITNNKLKLHMELLDLNTLVKTVIQDFSIQYLKKGVDLNFKTDEQSVYVVGDKTRIIQIIGNLLVNSLKFTEPGGSTILSVYQHDHNAYISVEDNGIGIEPEFLTDLFEPFKQADSSITRNNDGLGLGLAIVKGIIELHGGTVCAYSEGIGKGSCFTITLPSASKQGNTISPPVT